MRFTKYQGIGNDFVMIADPTDEIRLRPDLVRKLCDRRFGIGGDGVIRVAPGSEEADLFMDYVNSDGSIGEMCGNGIRCVAVFAREEGMTGSTSLDVATRAGLRRVEVLEDGLVRADMGAPIFKPEKIPVDWDGPDALHAKLELDRDQQEVTCLSMGNPHAVIFVEHELRAPVVSGPLIEKHPMFPNGTNVEFVRVESADHVRMRVWERGSGETLACGTGACAAAVAAKLIRGASDRITVSLPGGDLLVEWSGSVEDEQPVFMTGPVKKSFEGTFDMATFSG